MGKVCTEITAAIYNLGYDFWGLQLALGGVLDLPTVLDTCWDHTDPLCKCLLASAGQSSEGQRGVSPLNFEGIAPPLPADTWLQCQVSPFEPFYPPEQELPHVPSQQLSRRAEKP